MKKVSQSLELIPALERRLQLLSPFFLLGIEATMSSEKLAASRTSSKPSWMPANWPSFTFLRPLPLSVPHPWPPHLSRAPPYQASIRSTTQTSRSGDVKDGGLANAPKYEMATTPPFTRSASLPPLSNTGFMDNNQFLSISEALWDDEPYLQGDSAILGVRPSNLPVPFAGLGVFALSHIPLGSIVTWYDGPVVSVEKPIPFVCQTHLHSTHLGSAASAIDGLRFPILSRGIASLINSVRDVSDASTGRRGAYTSPNVKLELVPTKSRLSFVIRVRALCSILPGQELFASYSWL